MSYQRFPGIPNKKLIQIIPVTYETLVGGAITRKELERLLGLWGFPLQYRRPVYCVLDPCFKWLHSLPEGGRKYNLPEAVFDELLLLLILAPLMHTRLDAQVYPLVGATDASETGLETSIGSSPGTRCVFSITGIRQY